MVVQIQVFSCCRSESFGVAGVALVQFTASDSNGLTGSSFSEARRASNSSSQAGWGWDFEHSSGSEHWRLGSYSNPARFIHQSMVCVGYP